MRIGTKEKTFEDAFVEYIYAIWDYGKNDRLFQKEMILIYQSFEKRHRQ